MAEIGTVIFFLITGFGMNLEKKKSFQEKNKLPDSNMKAKEISAKEEVGGR